MTRIVKPADERRAELLDCALALFFEKGYEATTINDILDRIGLSKGAFYHHFTSKEELLDALVAKLASGILEAVKDVLADKTLSEVQRLNRFVAKSNRVHQEMQPQALSVFGSIFKPENEQLYQRIMNVSLQTAMPVLMEIVNRGVQQGEFDVPDQHIVVQLILQLQTARFPIVVEAIRITRAGDLRRAAQLFDQRLIAEQRVIDRMLGLPTGTVVTFTTEDTRATLSALAGLPKVGGVRRKRH